MFGRSDTFLGYSVLADKTFLSEPSNAQVLQKQQLDAAAAADWRKYLLIGGAIVAAVVLLRRR
jgi:hypothetical protein